MHGLGILAIAALTGGQTTKPVRGVPIFEGATKSVVQIVVRADSFVPGRVFTIGEIANVTGTDRALVKQVAAVEAGASPLPGSTRTIDRRDILTRLRLNKIATGCIDIDCARGVTIGRAAVAIPNADIAKAAIDALAALPNAGPGERTVEAMPLTCRLFVAPGRLVYRAGAPHGQLGGGMATVPVTVLSDDQPAKTVDVLVRIHRTVKAVVAARSLAPHEVLTPSDVSAALIEVTSSSQSLITDVAAVVSKRTTRQIALGAALTASAIESAPVVVTGARVILELAIGGVRISATALARGPGAIGDRIRVFALDTRKELTAVVVDADTVRVEELP